MKLRIVCVSALAAALAVGCAKKDEVVIHTPEGTMKVTEDGDRAVIVTDKGKMEFQGDGESGSMTLTDESGKKTTWTAGDKINLDELGVAIYPGAKVSQREGATSKVDTPEGAMVMAELTTPDSLSKVEEFYRSKLKETSRMSSGDGSFVTGKNSAGDAVTVTISKNQSEPGTRFVLTTIKDKK
jgi:hypothetical protein